MSAPGRLRELRLLFACAWDEVLDAWYAIRLHWRRAWCGVFGHSKPRPRLRCVTCSRCGVVLSHMPLSIVRAVRREDGKFTVRERHKRSP